MTEVQVENHKCEHPEPGFALPGREMAQIRQLMRGRRRKKKVAPTTGRNTQNKIAL